jgi:MFS family permease
VLSIMLLAVNTTSSLVAGLILQALAVAALDVVNNLYLLDHIPRRELQAFEPKRLMFAGTAFAMGPWIGVYLNRNWYPLSTYLVAIIAMVTLLLYFRAMRLADVRAIEAASPATSPDQIQLSAPPSPLAFVRRFVSQPRLVLSWILAFGRNGWWTMNFIYLPIYVASSGYSAAVGGALVSLGLAPMLLVRVWARIGQRVGIRNLMSFGYGFNAACSLIAALAAFSGFPRVCMGFICLAALGATMVDGGGNVPFLRAVHPYERVAMTSVFMTFRHVAALAIPGVLALVLWKLPVPAAFALGGVMSLVMAGLSRYLPRGM